MKASILLKMQGDDQKKQSAQEKSNIKKTIFGRLAQDRGVKNIKDNAQKQTKIFEFDLTKLLHKIKLKIKT